jgi:hypothetical protein
VESVDWLLLHQANIRIMDVVADRLGGEGGREGGGEGGRKEGREGGREGEREGGKEGGWCLWRRSVG